MKRFLNKKLLAAGVVIAGILTVAGTCTIQKISLTTIGTNKVFAGAVQNDSGVDILDHNVLVAFIGTSNNLLETKTVQPCLRTLPNGKANYFSAQSSFSAASVKAGLARVNFDSTFKVGTPASGSGTITNLTVNRGTTTLTVAGTFKNTDSTTLTAPNACAVVFDSSGNVVVVGLDQTMGDLSQNGSDTFSISLTVPDSTTTVSKVNVYVDGYKDSVPTLPVSSIGNTPSLTPTATATPSGTPGAGLKLVFITQPGGAAEGANLSPQPAVAIQDANGLTVTSSTAPITLAVTVGTGFGGTLTCTTNALNAVNGVATFAGCKIDKAGKFYTLTATSPGLSTAVSTTFDISPVGGATGMQVLVQPAGATGGTAFTTQPVVILVDAAGGHVWTDSSTAITMAIQANPSSGTLSGCVNNPKTVGNGLAAFSGCKIDKVGNGYSLRFSSGALPPVDSALFNIAVGAAAKLVFSQQPSGAASNGVAFVQQPIVQIQDAGGNLTGSTASVQLTLNTVSGSGTLSCTTNPLAAVAGSATFANCTITGTGTFTITATSAGLTSATSTQIVVS